jgi:competence protein ComEA
MKTRLITTLTLVMGLAVMPFSTQAAAESAVKTTPTAGTEKSLIKGSKDDKSSAATVVTGSIEEEKVSLNQASAEELAKVLNGVGLKKGQTIVEYREEMGDFTSIDQLQEVPGIGQALYQRNQSRLKL